MAKLFLLKPHFLDKKIDDQTRFYCPHCATILGILNYYPELKEKLDITFIDFERPRQKLVALVGDENQGCPNLVIDKDEVGELEDMSNLKAYGPYYFINSAPQIASYLSTKYHIGRAH